MTFAVAVSILAGGQLLLVGLALWIRSRLNKTRAELAKAESALAHAAGDEAWRLREDLSNARRMEALSQLSGGAAHDYNNAMMAISGHAQILKGKFADKMPEMRGYLDHITTASERAASVTSRLVEFTRRGKYQKKPVDVQAVIREVMVHFSHLAGARVERIEKFGSAGHTVQGDAGHLQNAFLSIATNALDAMPLGGTFTVETSQVDLDAVTADRYKRGAPPGKYLCITFSDTGTGMGEAVKAKIFEPFFTTKAVGQGPGLGLSSVWGCIRHHDGFIGVESSPGRGSRFTVLLPMETDYSKAVGRPAPQSTWPAKVLVIDDEEMSGHTFAEMLSLQGHEATVFTDPEGAVEHYREHHPLYHLVIIDMVMPKMDGRRCFQLLKAINPKVRAAVVSGKGRNEAVEKSLLEGAEAYLEKPFNVVHLTDMVMKVLLGSGR